MPPEVSHEGKLRPLIGASVLSSVGSLPLHLIPLIVVTLIADSRVSVAGAGWVASAILLGQLSTALALPALGIYNVHRKLAIAVAVLLITGLAASASPEYVGILAGWFLVGQCCGVLSYLGTIAASRFTRPAFAFLLRLGIVLIFAGCVSSALQLSGMLTSYRNLLTAIILALVPMLALGIILHQPVGGIGVSPKHDETRLFKIERSAGLFTVYFFFVGQTGFLAYVIQQAVGRGMVFDSTTLSLALMKLAAGVWILCSAYFGSEDSRSTRFGNLSLSLVAAIVVLSYSRDIVVFFLALLALELALNKLSARLQAAVVAARPEFAGRWLTAVMLLGAASGPPLNGFMISMGLEGGFVLICVLSAFGPLLWQRWSGSSVGPVVTLGEDAATASAK
jgi:hypothetical protein